MQGSHCWTQRIHLTKTQQATRSIFTRPLRVKNALAFLHRVFSIIFRGAVLIFDTGGKVKRQGDKETRRGKQMSAGNFPCLLVSLSPCLLVSSSFGVNELVLC